MDDDDGGKKNKKNPISTKDIKNSEETYRKPTQP